MRVWMDRRLDAKIQEKYSRLARGRSAKLTLVDPGQLDRLTYHAVHQGVAVEAEPLRVGDLSGLFAFLKKSQPPIALIALDAVTDPQNFGAICRTAESLGLSGVIFESRQSPPLGGAAYKASAGALDFLPLYVVPNLAESLRAIQSKNVTIVGLDAAAKISLHEIPGDQKPVPGRVIFVLGSEGRGLRPQIKSLCDFLGVIPMKGHVGSLNVSAAAAAACFWWSISKKS